MGNFDPRTVAIIAKGLDITARVQDAKDFGATITISFGNKSYSYARENIEFCQKRTQYKIEYIFIREKESGRLLDAKEFYEFSSSSGKKYWHILDERGRFHIGASSDFDVDSTLLNSKARSVFSYLKAASSINRLKDDDGISLLLKEYSKITSFKDTALAAYLNAEDFKITKSQIERELLYPFGSNLSQFSAVENAMSSSFSIIQGPPGTGKTQTILTIIANAIINKKTVLVVSNNNSAIANVFEKLDKASLSFIVAPLGRFDHKAAFYSSQSGGYPDLGSCHMEEGEEAVAISKIKRLKGELRKLFEAKNKLSKLQRDLENLIIEKKHYLSYLLESESPISVNGSFPSSELYKLKEEIENLFRKERREFPLFFRIKYVFLQKICPWNKFRIKNASSIISELEKAFYLKKEEELKKEIDSIEKKLKEGDIDGKLKKLTELSMSILRSSLYGRYGKKKERRIFDEKEVNKSPKAFLEEYPVVLSTCYSSRSSIRSAIYDYVIMDEASQVSLDEGALALSVAKNAVIVGDLMQLKNVIKEDDAPLYEKLFIESGLPDSYSYTENSFLSSVLKTLKGVPSTLLREHYRCRNKIIDFSNKKFYGGHLIPMRGEGDGKNTIRLLRTPEGHFRRGNANRRQQEVLMEYIKAELGLENLNADNFAVISPYRMQAEEISSFGPLSDTVHKFQGREKDTVAITLVDDSPSSFSDNPNLLNVALTRAVNHLIIVTSSNKMEEKSNIADLISYIEYNSFEITESKIFSVFDLLYEENQKARLNYLKKHNRISEYDSENLMCALIENLLNEHDEYGLSYVAHYPMRYIVKDKSILSDEQKRYALNAWTHLDFLLFNKFSKTPVLAIEVDGYSYHKKGTKQSLRDEKKDEILSLFSIPILRFRTDGSGEKEKIESFLKDLYLHKK